MLDRHPVFWIADPMPIALACGVALIVFFGAHLLESRLRVLIWLDALALPVAAAAGVAAATEMGASWPIVLVMGVATGTFGGLMRDVVANEVPLVLKQGGALRHRRAGGRRRRPSGAADLGPRGGTGGGLRAHGLRAPGGVACLRLAPAGLQAAPAPAARHVLVERPRHPPQQHEGPRGARFGKPRDILVRGVALEFHEGPVEMAQEMVRRVAKDRVLLHPPGRKHEGRPVIDGRPAPRQSARVRPARKTGRHISGRERSGRRSSM